MQNKGEILADYLKDYGYCYFFAHNTKELAVVNKIMKEGFIFESQLSNTSDRISPNEPVEISYFFLLRKDYGHYTILIAIPKETYDRFTKVSNEKEISMEEVLSISKPFYSDNDELVYTLSPKHILGYFDGNTNRFIKNPGWDPGFANGI